MAVQQIADHTAAEALNQAFNDTGKALLERHPDVLTGTVIRVYLRAVRAYLERAEHATRD